MSRRQALTTTLIVFVTIASFALSLIAQSRQPSVPNATGLIDKPNLIVEAGPPVFVFSVAFSPNGKYLITGGYDKRARLWDIETGKELRRFEGHSSFAFSAVFSPDGKSVLTGSRDRTVRLWDFESGKETRRFGDSSVPIFSVAFSPDGSKVLAGGFADAARLWDVESGKELHRFDGHSDGISSVAFSPDGKFVLTDSGQTAYLWAVDSGKQLQRFEGHTAAIWSVAFSPDGKYVITGGDDQTARLWDVQTGKETRRFEGHSKNIHSVAFSPSGQYVLTGGEDTARLWNVATGKEIRRLEGHHVGVWSVAFSKNGKYAATGGFDKTARVWDVETGREVQRFAGRANVVLSSKVSPDGKFIVSGGVGSATSLWELSTGREIARLPSGENHDIWSVAFSPDSKQFIVGGIDKTVRLWDIRSAKQVRTFAGHSESVFSAAFSPDGMFILTGSGDKSARLWDLHTGKEVRRFLGHTASIQSVAFSPNGKYILTASGDKTARLWDVATAKHLRTLEGHSGVIEAAAFSPSGHYILTGSQDRTTRLWDAETGKQLRQFDEDLDHVWTVAFSPNGKYAITGDDGETARLWEVETGKQVRKFEGHSGIIHSVGFSSDGRYVLTAGLDSTTRLWNASTGKEICKLVSFMDGSWVVVTDDGRFDTNKLEGIKGMQWVMPDDPLTALPVEIFMRPYYEPRLLPRLLAGDDFKEVPSLVDLNRLQPKVAITDVKKEGRGAAATVTVDVENVERTNPLERKAVGESGARDLRLFRDGQLVGYRDGDLLGQHQTATTGCEPVEGSTKKCRAVFEHIRLPQQEGVKDVEFSVYAFNTSDVKSETFRVPFKFTPESPARKGRVYLIAVGVSNYENPDWNLDFAANDAHLIDETLSAKLRATGDYEDVVNVMVTSEERVVNGQREMVKTATKENFRKIMRLLAGEKLAESETKEIPNAQKIEKATPEDVVLIFCSSHGYRDQERFYLFPYDIGHGTGRDPEAVAPHAISSDDLYRWLRDIDAGDMVLVIDACHAAAVTGKEFKPGPMGSRGMGQLAYDKGMRILAATQPDTTAAEVDNINQRRKIEHGLLTFALVEDGLIDCQADINDDKLILLSEWLEFGVTDVPQLYEEAAQSQNSSADQAAVKPGPQRGNKQVRFISKGEGDASTQQPSLFDFTGKLKRKRQLVVYKS
jgi:WD40 repeat protein